jgi:hypothetical protein
MWEVELFEQRAYPQSWSFDYLLHAIAWVELRESKVAWKKMKGVDVIWGSSYSKQYRINKQKNGDVALDEYSEVAQDAAREYARQVIERLNEG